MLQSSSLSLTYERFLLIKLLADYHASVWKGIRATGEPILILKGLILAQNERWRRGLGMQVERILEGLLSRESGERGSNAWITYPEVRDSHPNGWVILDMRQL
jgi:hypothetical protein